MMGRLLTELRNERKFANFYRDISWDDPGRASYVQLHAWSEARDRYLALTDLSSGEAKRLAAEHVRRMDHYLRSKTPK